MQTPKMESEETSTQMGTNGYAELDRAIDSGIDSDFIEFNLVGHGVQNWTMPQSTAANHTI